MAGFCAFCGKELKLFGKETLWVGGVTQSVCRDCADKYVRVEQDERCREVLKSGRAMEPEKVRAFLTKQEREAEAERANTERLGRLMSCCGQPMTPLGVSEFQLGRQSFLLGDWPNLLAGAMELAVFRCERCGQVKFMDPEFIKTKEGGNPA